LKRTTLGYAIMRLLPKASGLRFGFSNYFFVVQPKILTVDVCRPINNLGNKNSFTKPCVLQNKKSNLTPPSRRPKSTNQVLSKCFCLLSQLKARRHLNLHSTKMKAPLIHARMSILKSLVHLYSHPTKYTKNMQLS
jgi:hypothetical protein